MKRIFAIFFVVLTIIRCDSINYEVINKDQNFLFEIEYINHAWGYQHSGIYINKKGEVFKYKYEVTSPKWKYNSDGYYTEEELTEKFQPNKQLLDTLDEKMLAAKQGLIPVVMNSTYSDTTQIGADQGAINYIAYYYNADKRKYLQVKLEQDGDWNFKKESQKADTLINWLKNL